MNLFPRRRHSSTIPFHRLSSNERVKNNRPAIDARRTIHSTNNRPRRNAIDRRRRKPTHRRRMLSSSFLRDDEKSLSNKTRRTSSPTWLFHPITFVNGIIVASKRREGIIRSITSLSFPRRNFATARAVFHHACSAHVKSSPDYVCLWNGCDRLRRQKWALISHIQV